MKKPVLGPPRRVHQSVTHALGHSGLRRNNLLHKNITDWLKVYLTKAGIWTFDYTLLETGKNFSLGHTCAHRGKPHCTGIAWIPRHLWHGWRHGILTIFQSRWWQHNVINATLFSSCIWQTTSVNNWCQTESSFSFHFLLPRLLAYRLANQMLELKSLLQLLG